MDTDEKNNSPLLSSENEKDGIELNQDANSVEIKADVEDLDFNGDIMSFNANPSIEKELKGCNDQKMVVDAFPDSPAKASSIIRAKKIKGTRLKQNKNSLATPTKDASGESTNSPESNLSETMDSETLYEEKAQNLQLILLNRSQVKRANDYGYVCPCKGCYRAFGDHERRNIHMMRTHENCTESLKGLRTSKFPTVCYSCEQIYPDTKGLHDHLRLKHGRKVYCNVCKKEVTVTRHWTLNAHLRGHRTTAKKGRQKLTQLATGEEGKRKTNVESPDQSAPETRK